MSATRTITAYESAIGDGFTLDTEAKVARGVAVCGRTSLNGRDYPDDVRDRDKAVYEGAQVYIDHMVGERKVREWFGELRGVRTRVSDRKTIADHHYPKNSSFTAEYEERAQDFPRSLGFSHVAVCQTKRANGREVIEGITRVESVDLVARPATNAGIHESHRATPMRLKEYAGKLAAKFPQAKPQLLRFLREEFPVDADMPADVMPVDDAVSADDPVTAAISTAMHALVDQFDAGDIDAAALVSKLKHLLKMAEKMSGTGADEPVDATEVESLRRENADLKADKLFSEAGIASPTNAQKKSVLRAESDAERKELIESWKPGTRVQESEKPVSRGRQPNADPPTTGTKKESVTPAEYAAKLKTDD